MSLPAYPSYVSVGDGWLSDVPAHWPVIPNKAVLHSRVELVGANSGDYLLLSLTLSGVIPRDIESGKGKFPAEFDTYKSVSSGDLVFCLFDVDETPRTIGLAEQPGMITGAYDVFECLPAALPSFLHYFYLHIDYFKGLKPFYTGLRKVVRPPTFMAIKFALPPLDEQRGIVSFLDHEIAKIDALVEEQRRLIELLKEKRQAVISHAVTKGLNPNATMKPSGVEWLGDVPEHWDIFSLKRDLQFLTSGSRGWADFYTDEGEMFIRIGNLTRESIDLNLSDIQRVQVPSGTEGARTQVQAGDLLFSITAYLGSVAVVPHEIENAYVSQHVALARLRGRKVLPRWVAYVTLSMIGKTYFETQGYGGTKIQLSLDDVANLLLTAPPQHEQQEIAVYLDSEILKFDELIAQAAHAIDLLQERRSALISAAVTGKIDVRGLAKESAA